ncbi:unnamed protein product [Sphagnum jensenii]|uniref:Uncharacterized protein n=1 Tax=Sphagnum jensenii TaxID=128206 RepID=A0ABP0XDD9_9BRYO
MSVEERSPGEDSEMKAKQQKLLKSLEPNSWMCEQESPSSRGNQGHNVLEQATTVETRAAFESQRNLQEVSPTSSSSLKLQTGAQKIEKEMDMSVDNNPGRDAIGTYISKGVQGVKEDCQRFRLQMKMLKEKAEDTKKREVEVEGMAKSMKRQLDVVPTNTANKPDNTVQHINRQRGVTAYIGRWSRLRRGNRCCSHGRHFLWEEAIGRKSRHKKLKTRRIIITSASDSSACTTLSSLPSSPSMDSSQNLHKEATTTLTAAEHCTPLYPVLHHHPLQGISSLCTSTEFDSKQSKDHEFADLSSPNSTVIILPTPPPHILNYNPQQISPPLGPQCNSQFKVYCNQYVARAPLPESTIKCDLADIDNQRLGVIPGGGACAAAVSCIKDDYDEKIAHTQRLMGELKGSMEGFKIRIEVESEGWRTHMEVLKNELESLRREQEYAIEDAKHSIRSEFKGRLGGLMDAAERPSEEKEQVEALVDERIEKRLSKKDIVMSEMKSNMRLLWTEVESLTKGRDHLQEHVNHLTKVAKIAKENANREQDILKSENGFLRRQLQLFKGNDNQMKSELERENLWQAVEKLKYEGTDLKLDVKDFKKVEKAVKMELENVRKLAEKMQEDTEELERERGASHVVGVQERLQRMEKVESLSHLYLGGLEEVHADLFNVKLSCHDHIDKLEEQWKQFQEHEHLEKDSSREELGSSVLLDNLMDNMRSEMAEIVETERHILQQTLERESGSIHCQLKEACTNNRCEMISMVKAEVQKCLKNSQEKMLAMTHSIKEEVKDLKTELGVAEEGLDDLARALSVVEKHKEVAAMAAAEATMSSRKASNILNEMLGSFSIEMANARSNSLQLQENLAIERDMAAAAAAEAIKVSKELAKVKESSQIAIAEAQNKNHKLQQFLERESSKIMTAMSVVHKEKHVASLAASEAAASANQAGQVLADILGSFNSEMAKAQRLSLQLQDIQMEDSLNTLSQTVEQIQESQNHLNIEKKQHLIAMQQELERQEREWKVELNQLNQVMHMLEKSINDSVVDQSDIVRRIKKLEDMQIDLVHSCDEVRTSTCELANTAAIWFPKYEAAACIISELSFKLEQTDKNIRAIYCDENLMQQMAQVAELKVQGLKDLMASSVLAQFGPELHNILEQVENDNLAHCQVVFKQVEFLASEKHNDVSVASTDLSTTESKFDSKVVILESRIEHVASATFSNFRLLDKKIVQIMLGLQSAISGAAMADSKCGALGVELVKVFRMLACCRSQTSPVQKIKDSSPAPSGHTGDHGGRHYSSTSSRNCKDHHHDHISCTNSSSSISRSGGDHASQSRTSNGNKQLQPPPPPPPPPPMGLNVGNAASVAQAIDRRGIRVGDQCKLDAILTRRTESFDIGKTLTLQQERAGTDEEPSSASEQGENPTKQRWTFSEQFLEEIENEKSHQLQGSHEFSFIEKYRQGAAHESGLNSHLTIEKTQDLGSSGKDCHQRTNIHLEAGNVHVNVSHHSAVGHQSEKRGDLIAVQS